MKVLVTGATGLLGNNVVRLFLEKGYQVICAVRSLDSPSLERLDVQQVVAQLSPDQEWDTYLAGVDAIVNCAAVIHLGWKNVDASRRVNVQGTTALATAAMKFNCRLIHISTVDTLAYSKDGAPVSEGQRTPWKQQSAYVISKTEAEAALHRMVEEGLNAVVVHPGFLIGPWDWKPSSGRMILAVKKGLIPVAPAGGCSAADVRQVAKAIDRLLTVGESGEHFILGGQNLTYQQLFNKISNVVGTKPPRFRMGPVFAWCAGKIGDSWTTISGTETDLNSAMVGMGQRKNFYSSQKAMDLLGYDPGSVDTAIKDAWQFIFEHQAQSGGKSE